MMTIEEQKLAVCQKLPELIRFNYPTMGNYWWIKEERSVKWSSEGLQVCHEAEKILKRGFVKNGGQLRDYQNLLWIIINPDVDFDMATSEQFQNLIAATCEQRLEALCRVWFPEKWKD